MADNDPVEPQLEVESGLHHSNETQGALGEQGVVVTAGEEQMERPINRSSAEEPKADLSAPEQMPGPSNDEAGEGIVATLPQQTANPSPSVEGMSNNAGGHTSSLATEVTSNGGSTVASPAPTKRFTSMNINKKFLAKTAAVSPSSSSSAIVPKTPASGSTVRPATLNPATPSRLITKKLTTTAPTPSVSGGWSVRPTPPASLSTSPAPGDASATQPSPSVKLAGAADALKRPTLVSSTSALSADSRGASAKASREQSPVKAWGAVPAPTGDLGRNLQEFPTAAEAAADNSEGKRTGPAATEAEHGATDDPTHTTEGDARDSFRGIHLDPKAHHWDDMEDEGNDFLGEVIDFGDGKTYTVPPEDEEHTASPTLNKETRLGDDYDRSWPRSRPLHHEAEPSHSVAPPSQHSRFPPSHGLPARHPPGDGRVLFNERSNRLEPARLQTSTHVLTPGGPLHHHGLPPHANGPPRSAVRRNSALSSDRPKSGSVREPPPHSRDLPPHAVPGLSPELRARRPSDARSVHSPTERRSSFLHDERPRMGPFAPKGHEEPGSTTHGLRRETSRDSRIGADRQPWGVTLQHPANHRVATDPLHPQDGPEPTRPVDVPAPAALDKPTHRLDGDAIGKALVSPSQQATALPTSPLPHGSLSPRGPGPSGAPSLPLVPAVLNEDRERFMKQAAERARRRKLEEEAAREEARERARKKAAELEALSKASLVTASPLVALTRQVSNSYSSGAKSPIPKSPSVAPSVLPPSSVTSEAPSKPQAAPDLASIASAETSWRTKPKPEPSVVAVPPEALSPSPHVTSPAVRVEPDHPPQAPVPSMMTLGGGGMHAIEELHQIEGPLEVLDFSDMSKLAGRRTSITSASDLSKRKRPSASDFFDEAPSVQPIQRSNQGPSNYTHWNREPRSEKPLSDALDDRTRPPASSLTRPLATSPSMSNAHSRPGFKEAPISALDDVMSRIKGVLTGMHADGEKPSTSASVSPHPKPENTPVPAPTPIPTSAPTTSAPPRTAPIVGPRWKGDGATNWRDGANKKLPNGRQIQAQPTEPFATTRPERPDSPPAVWSTHAVHLNRSTVVRPPMSKKQATLAKLPPMPVRWDILTWDPPVERMSTWTLSRDDMFFPKTIVRGVLAARVHLPSVDPITGAQSVKSSDSPIQRTRLPAAADLKPSRSSNVSTRPIPKGPAFSEGQWRKPLTSTSPLRNTLELQNHIPPVAVLAGEENQLETTSRSPPPHYLSLSGEAKPNETAVSPTSPTRDSRQQWGTDVAFRRLLSENRPPAMPSVSFTVSSELDDPPTVEVETSTQVPTVEPSLEERTSLPVESETTALETSEQANIDGMENKLERVTSGEKTTSPTPNSSVLLTPPVKDTTPWQASSSRLPDTEYLKSVWQHASPKEGTNTENSLRGIVDDFPSAIPHSVQEMKSEDGEFKPSREPAPSVPARMPHNAHRAFQQVPTSPAPMHMPGYPHHPVPNQVGPSRPIPMPSFSLPPPAPPQVTSQPSPYSPYVHPTPPTLMYTIPPSRIAPSPAPGGPPMWVQGQAYGRPSPPAGMYPTQHGHNMAYPSPVSQLPPSMSKPQGGMNGNHGHHQMSSPAMAHSMHMGSPAMTHVGHMGSPALGHATVHMPGGPQAMYPGMGSPGGLGMGPNMPYGAQRPNPAMMQQSPMQAPLANGYPMGPGGAYAPNGYGRGAIRSPADNMPHHMSVPHLQHGPMSPGTYHPNAYARPW